VLFDYSPTRGSSAPLAILGTFKGYLQTDGYAVYEKYGKKKEVTTWPVGHTHAVSLKRHWTMIARELKGHF
jgi:Transposase IS66 family